MNGFVVIVGYLLGSIPFGLLFARFRGVDIRAAGSGNIGATNVGRSVGKREGIWTLACDIGKGVVAVLIAWGAALPTGWVATVCLAVVLGHVYSPWLRFRGGKGVAATAGAFLAAAPLPLLICLLVFALVVKASRRVSLGSVVSAAALPFSLWGLDAAPQMIAAGAIAAVIIIVKHKDNLRRLKAGTEPPLGAVTCPPETGAV